MGVTTLTWLPAAIRIDHSPNVTYQGAIFPRIAVAGSSVYVMWHDNPDDPNFQLLSRDVFFNRSLDRGLTWLPTDIRLNTSGPAGTFFTEFPDLCASGNEVFAVWIARRQPRTVAFNRSLGSGTTWLATDVPISSPPTNSFPNIDVPRIAASGPLLLATTGGPTASRKMTCCMPLSVSTPLGAKMDAGVSEAEIHDKYTQRLAVVP